MNYKNVSKVRWLELVRQRQVYLPLGLALLGGVLLFQGLQGYKERLGHGMKTERVLIAKTPISEGQVIRQEDLAVQRVPEKMVPTGVARAEDVANIVGKAAIAPIPEHALILWASVNVSYGARLPSTKITKGYRAMAVEVSASSSVGQSIQPGDQVDIISTMTMPEDRQVRTFTLLQNVTVLDVGNANQRDDGSHYATVNLMVLPKEVGIISFARDHGSLSLVLRNPEDSQTPGDLPMVGAQEVIESGFRNSIQKERNDSVEIIRGGRLAYVP